MNKRFDDVVVGLLQAGFGVEDIALKASCTVERVRRVVARMRAAGTLAAIYRGQE